MLSSHLLLGPLNDSLEMEFSTKILRTFVPPFLLHVQSVLSFLILMCQQSLAIRLCHKISRYIIFIIYYWLHSFRWKLVLYSGQKKKQTNFISTKTSNVRVYSWIISLLHTIQYTTLAHVSTDEVRKRCGCLFTVYHNFSQQALRI